MIFSTNNFKFTDKVNYDGMEYIAIDIIYECYAFGFTKAIIRNDIFAWVKQRKRLYSMSVMKKVFKNELFISNLFKRYNFKDIHKISKKYGNIKRKYINNELNYSKFNMLMINEKIYDENTIIKNNLIDDMKMVTKEDYKKYLYKNKIVFQEIYNRITNDRGNQKLSYNLILPEHHFHYNQYYSNLHITNNNNIYKEIVDLLGYYIPEGEDYKEFLKILLGEDILSSYENMLLDDNEENPDFLYGKFGGNYERREF